MAKKQALKPEKTEATTGKPAFSLKLMLFLGAISLIVYGNTLKNGFVLDDSVMLENNHIVAKGISGIPELLTTPHQLGFHKIQNDEYRPLSLAMFAVVYQAFGLEPAPYHLMNILLFAGCVLLLFLFLDRLFERRNTLAAFITALLFALHPIHTEVVANIKSSDEILCFFFVFLSLNVFISYIETGKTVQLFLGAGCFFTSLLSKESGLAFLFIIPLIFFFYRNEHKKRSAYITLSVVTSVIIFFIIRFSILKYYDANHIAQIDTIENALAKPGLPFESRMATAILILGYYIKLLFIPYPLTFDYTYNSIPYAHFSDPLVLVSLAAYIFLAAFAIIRFLKNKKDPYAFGLLFFLVTLSVASNVLILIKATMGERFLFFPSVGFCMVPALLLAKWVGQAGQPIFSLLKQPKILAILTPICLVYAVITINRNGDWLDNYTLYSTDIKKVPDNSRINYFLGDLLLRKGKEETNPGLRRQMTDSAIFYFKRTIAAYPLFFSAQSDMGAAYYDLSMYDSAIVHDKLAIEISPGAIIPTNNLSGIYCTRKQFREAIDICKISIKYTPGNVIAYANIGFSYMKMEKYDSAIYYLYQGINADPTFNGSYEMLAMSYSSLHNMDSARKYGEIAHGNNPRF